MSRQVLIENNDNKVIAPATEVNKVVVLDNCEPNSVKVYDNANNVIKVLTQGPQGAAGEIPDISGYLTTASFNALTSSMSVLSSSYSISGSYAVLSSTASHAEYSHTSSFATNAQIASYANFAGFAISSSHAQSARSSSYALSSSFANSGRGQFSGSFTGDGQNLSNIPASAIIGLNLSQITSGSYSASISEEGLLVNNRIVASSFTGSLEGTSSFSNYAVSSSYAITASYAANVPDTASYALNALSSSYSETASYALNALSSSYSETASYAPNYLSLEGGLVSGSITLFGDLTVYGSSSFVYVTASQLALSSSTISLNIFEPAERFAGLVVYDSGSLSHQATASLFWDSQRNHWIYQNASGSMYSGGGLISGPRNTASLGDESYPTRNRIVRGQGGDHIYDANISDDDSKVGIRISTDITGSLYVSNGISGSFTGSGARLTDIPASAIIGLNLSQISSGSVSASISENTGLTINSSVTASAFTGSFYGDGSNLNNIPATAIVGLNLDTSKIASGSATASISPNGGLQVNTSLAVSGNFESLQTASLPNIKDSYGSSGLSGSILAMTSQGTKWTTVKDSLMVQIISEGPTINSGSKGFKFVSEQNYIEKVSIRSFFTGSIQFIVKDSNVTYGSASLNNDVYFEDVTLNSWIRTIPSQSLLEFLVSPPSGSVNGPIANIVFIINTVKSIS